MDDVWESGLAAVTLHVLLNDLGVIATASRTLLERWNQLGERDRQTLLGIIDESVGRGMGQLQTLATAHIG